MVARNALIYFLTLPFGFISAATASDGVDYSKCESPFCITGLVTHVLESPRHSNIELAIEADSSALVVMATPSHVQTSIAAGDIIVINAKPEHRVTLTSETVGPIQKIGKGTKRTPVIVDPADLPNGRYDWRLCEIFGTVIDVVRSELANDWVFLLIQNGDTILYLALPDHPVGKDIPLWLIGARISAICVCMPRDGSYRHRFGRTFHCSGISSIHIAEKAPSDPYSVPDVHSIDNQAPSALFRIGRLRASGIVIATGLNNRAYIRTDDGEIIGLESANGSLPRYGKHIDIVGLPGTDLQHINLNRAIWRESRTPQPVSAPTINLTSASRLPNADSALVNPVLHGARVRLSGLILSQTSQPRCEGALLHVQSDNRVVPVLIPREKTYAAGSTVQVTGTCILDIENWSPLQAFPQVRGFTVVVNDPADIVLVATPSWWTPQKAWVVFGTLILAIVTILIWNSSLRVLADRRGRELLRKQIKSLESELKVEERTRLAVELHDSLSQALTGVAMEIGAANKLVDHDIAQAHRHLDAATCALRSSHTELRNCLWDLRNRSLELPTLNEAILQTLAPRIGSTQLAVRFNVPRSHLTDKTTHNILHITRELATNAVHHGRATKIKIAGSIENDKILFSVSDNGCGFDTSNYPGVESGHFGLQGVRERVELFNGNLVVESNAKGTRISISIAIPHRCST